MRVLVLICSMLLLSFTVKLGFARVNDYQISSEVQNLNSAWNLSEVLYGNSKKFLPFSTSTLNRRKRGEDIQDETNPFPTRHAKHRRRRRCKNRAICSRSSEIKQSNITWQFDENSTSNRRPILDGDDPSNLQGTKSDEHLAEMEIQRILSEIEESRREEFSLESDDRTEDHYNQTRRMNYNVVLETSKKYVENRNSSIEPKTPTSRSYPNITELSELKELESEDERAITDEIELEDTTVPPWTNVAFKDETNDTVDFAETTHTSPIYRDGDHPATFHDSLSVILTKLFQSLRNNSVANNQNIFKEINFVDSTNEDPCQKWLNSRDKLEEAFLGTIASLPGCPCQYPSNIFYDDKIWDERQKKYFRWRDVSGKSQRLDVYKPGAAYCVRSLLAQGSGSAAAQHCCYDRRRKLLTRGSGAGTPNFVSPEISAVLHERIDVLPWRLCKGDFSRYNGVRPPNNDNKCEANPDDEEYQRQIDDRKYY